VAATVAAASDSQAGKSSLPDLPEPLASFGAAVNDGWLYVYGGHIGEEHKHSKENLSRHFRRLEFVAGAAWEELPMQTPLQGLPLVSFGDKVYRVGGLSARNAPAEKEDLHSVTEAAAFDVKTKTWAKLPPLPEPRSSHDAVVIGNTLYVAGGWTLSGSSKGTWLDTAWSLDLSRPDATWQAVQSPGFHRRALALGEWNGQLVAMGGIDEHRKISRRVDALDLKTDEWRRLAELPGEGLDGFGISACNLDGKLYVSGTQEHLYRLADDGKSWQAIAKLVEPRFFHRMVAGRSGKLLLIGGANDDGHLGDIEEVEPLRRPALEE
jgi:N-acetylneuraminic acid mutarotase